MNKKAITLGTQPKLVSSVTISWQQTNMSNIVCESDSFLYAFTRGNILYYIGLANKQNVVKEVKQTLNRLNINNVGLSIYLGYIDVPPKKVNTKENMYKIVKDTECLLIYKNQPIKMTNAKLLTQADDQ